MEETKTFTDWLRPEKSQLQKDLEKCTEIYDRYWGILEFATPEEKGLLKRYGYITEPLIAFPPIIKFLD